MTRFDSKILDLFSRGEHGAILARTVDSARWKGGVEIPWVIGALVYQARMQEALALLESERGRLSVAALVVGRAYVGMGFYRAGLYERGRALHLRNLADARRSRDPLALSYASLALAFHWYTAGRFQPAERGCHRALRHAVRARFLLGRVLAHELLGHVLVQRGRHSESRKHFGIAIRQAKAARNGGLRESVAMERSLYRQYSAETTESALGTLEGLVRKGRGLVDPHTEAAALLEIARLRILRGEWVAARAALARATEIAGGQADRRMGILLLLRRATLAELQGRPEEALAIVDAALGKLDTRMDDAIEMMLQGQRLRVLKASGDAGHGSLASAIEPRWVALSLRTRSGIGLRMLRRSGVPVPAGDWMPARGEDPRGDLLDDIAFLRADDGEGRRSIARRIADAGCASFFYKILPVRPGVPTIHVDAVPGWVLVFDADGIRLATRNLPPALRKLLTAFAERRRWSKEDLVTHAWRQRYRPLVHDALAYQAVSRLRKLLGLGPEWVQASEEGYGFREDGAVLFADAIRPVPERPISETARAPQASDGRLNHRQQAVLGRLKEGEALDAALYRRWFEVSGATAVRDLRGLLQYGYVERVGKARASRYRKAAGSR